MNKDKLARLKPERKYLSSKAVEGSITETQKVRLATLRDEIRRLERYVRMP